VTALPTGTVTFLFTDLEGSTRLWEEHPDDMRVALARHDEILRKTVEAHDGAIVKTTGDGLHAAFATADHALGAAVDAQLALTGEVWPLPEPLRVRMGVHTGASEERDGDYYGPAVNRAARVAAAAHGGQILVSHATEELARDSLPAAHALVDLGEHRLRDLARAERVFQLAAPGLAGDFPPPRSVDAYPGNLPVQLSSFIGRDADVSAIVAALRDARLVTLTGVGGVGKTRLATQVAAELLPHFPDGAWLCELAPATDREALDQIAVAALGATPRGGMTLQGSIVEYLATKQLLVVLDNCEHLLDDAGRLADAILRGCPEVRILATSREGLGIEGEHLRVVRSLAVPPLDASADDTAAAAAIQLFVERARAARGDVAFDDVALEAVAEICRRLDGIPLAIELAAARVVAMTPIEIARRLDERFRLLTGGRRTAVERHHTLRAAVDWSYSLLGERERLVFDRLGVFAGSFDIAAAEAVASDDDLEQWDVVDALTELVAKSMLVSEQHADTTRYACLETLRQYACEQLEARAESDVVRRRHAQHYVQIATAYAAGLRGPDELAVRAQLGEDLDNLRAGITWSLDRVDTADRVLGMTAIAELALESNLERRLGVGSWAERALPHADEAEPPIRCAVIAAAAEEARAIGDADRAIDLAELALRDGVTLAGVGPALALVAWSTGAGMRGDGMSVVDRLVATRDVMADAGADAYVLCVMATVAAVWAALSGDVAAATELAREAVDLARVSGSPSQLCAALFALANATELADPELALACYDESIALTRAGAGTSVYSVALAFAARLRHELGETAPALEQATEAIRSNYETRDLSQIMNGVAVATAILTDVGEFAAAATFLAYHDRFNAALGSTWGEGDARWRLSALREQLRDALDRGTYERAVAAGTAMTDDEFFAYCVAECTRVHASLSTDPVT
jgi:predicted ATPase/class 3 adenylate cyclase